ncbi:MAG: Uma2 family endonuclease [Aliidongia sp.]
MRVKAAVWLALRNAIKTAGVACQALPDGATIETGESDYAPDVVMNCRAPMADNATTAPNPTIIIEVLSPRTVASDTGAKLVDYFQVPSIAHYLIVHAITKWVITHHRRTSEGIDTRIVVAGKLVMDPPGITITLEEIYDAG